MAKYKFANNGLISGRIGATTFQRNGIEKDFVEPTNTTSREKTFQIDCITNYSQYWSTLSQEEMKLWHQYSFDRTDRFADNYSYNGMQSFISINSNLALLYNDNTIIYASEPIYSSTPPLLINQPYSTIGLLNYTIYNTGIPFSFLCAVYSTNNLSSGVFKPRKNDFKFMGFVDLGSGFIDILGLFVGRFGIFPTGGSKIFTKLWQFDPTTGLYSYKFQFSSIVT